MATANSHFFGAPEPIPPRRSESAFIRHHRLAQVRKKQGVSLRTAARRMGVPISELRRQERSETDLRLSDLYKWQELLDVPLSELLVEPVNSLSPPIMRRAQFVRIMKTAYAIEETTKQPDVRRLAQRLTKQLIELMPELKDVSAWHSIGTRRTRNELGRAADRLVSDDMLNRHDPFE